jgi:hypothetical protein
LFIVGIWPRWMMSKARVIVLSVVHQGMSKAEAARKFDVSWRWVHTLVTRYETGGLDAVEPRSHRPAHNPAATSTEVRNKIIALRTQLTADGLDAGPVTIAWHLNKAGLHVPSTSTIRRILLAAQLVTPEPKKRPTGTSLPSPISRSSAGSTTTPDYCCPAPPTPA